VADLVCGCTLSTAFQLCLDPGFQKGMKNVTQWFDSFAALPQVVKAAGRVNLCQKAIKPQGCPDAPASKKEDAPAAKKEVETVELDLFGDDDDPEEAKKAAAAAKEKGQAAKKKKVVIAQSLVMFEVKPLDDQTSLDALAARIFKEITMEGLYWKLEYKKEPVAFGIYKLIIAVTVEDDKVSVDALQEKIEEFSDMV